MSAPQAREVLIPNIGDAEDVEVIELCVQPGDTVAVDGALIVIESDKASMEVPSPYAGTVRELSVALGDSVTTGRLIAVLDVEDAATGEPAAPAAKASPPAAQRAEGEDAANERPPAAPEPVPAPAAAASPAETSGTPKVYAGPATRRLARELGVDLAGLRGSGVAGRIVKDDVKAFVKAAMTDGGTPSGGGGIPALPNIDFAKFGPTEALPLPRVGVRGARNLHRSWLNVVHVTQHDEADVTELEGFRKSLAAEAAARGVKLTLLPFILKACATNLKSFPRLNASLNAAVDGLILKHHWHIGFAVDTEDGLVVPVIRDVDQKGVWALAQEIAELSELARTRALKPDQLQGGTFTVSSLGRVGGTGFTPIVNAPEVGILGVGRLATKPLWDGAAFQPRAVLPLSLSYDHRAINGVEGGNFVVGLAQMLGDVRRLTLDQ